MVEATILKLFCNNFNIFYNYINWLYRPDKEAFTGSSGQ